MKQLFYSFIAVFALLFTGCADKDVVEAISNGDNQPGVTVSMSMEGDMGQIAPKSRAGVQSNPIGYETDDSTGFPTPVGIFDRGTSEGKEIATGTKVPVLLIFKSTTSDQPVTKVVTNWTYTKGGKLTLMPSDTFEMASGTDLSKGTWYVCGILGGEMLPGNNQVKFNGFSEGHTARNIAGEKLQWGANIPYIFSWRKLETNAANKTIKAEKAVKFKQFGSIVRLKVTNNTGFNFMYNGVRIITSNILCGQFDLKSFDDVAVSDLKDTQDGEIASAKTESYKNAFKAFKFYQRPLTDAAMTGNDGLINKKGFRIHGTYIKDYADEKAGTLNTALTYYDHIFLKKASGDNFDKVVKGGDAPSYIYVWMAPQQQTVRIYEKQEGVGAPKETKKISKTQFLLMAVPTETSAGTKIVPTSINMLPAYGTLADYVSGANYPAKGNVVYNFSPLSYIAKHSNFGTDAELSNAATQDAAHTETYSYSDIETYVNNPSKVPAGYMFAHHEYWRSILPQFYGFSGFRNNGTTYNCSMGIVSPAKLPGWNETKLVFQSYSKGVRDSQGNLIAYMIGLSKQPSYISNTGEGQAYQGYAKNPLTRASSGVFESAPWIQNNDYRYVMRWEDKNGNAILKQRYLGPRFVLDMDDIANEDFWAKPITGTYPNDVERIVPYAGIYDVASTKDPTAPAGSNAGQTWWYFNTNTVGKCAQYWTPDDAPAGGRFATQAPSGGAMQDNAHQAPKLSVTFRYSVVADDISGFFNCYLYTRTPLKQDHKESYVNDSRFVEGLIMKAPVRLWKITPYAD